MVNLGGTQKVNCLGTCFGGDGLGHREKPIDSAQVRAPSRLFGVPASALLPQETHNANTGCLSPDNLDDGGSSRLLHLAQGVLQETLPSPHPRQRPSSYRGTTRFHTLPSPSPPAYRTADIPPRARAARMYMATVSSLAGARSSPSPPRASVCAAPS